ncbi:MAG: cellulase family glycosylhydrolase [Lachnospiraceae bacterium]|nr:cellulase family glycosylhydrolase [Lachnospiraceae bacterium]
MKQMDGYLRGVNLGGWLSQCGPNYTEEHYNSFITESDIKTIKEWGLDHVRLPLDYNVVQREDGSFIESGFKHVDDCIAWCKKYGLKIVLDLHKTCGFIFDNPEYCNFFTDEKLQKMFKDLWLEFTRRYGKEEIMAFELLNEVTEYRMAEAWNRISTETIKMIHDIVPEKTIIIGGIYNSSIVGLTLLPKPVDDNVVYTFHCYDPMIFTHQGAGWIPVMPHDFRTAYKRKVSELRDDSNRVFGPDYDDQYKDLPDGIIDSGFFFNDFKKAIEVAEKYNVQLYCGEYGVIELADRESTLAWYKDIHAALDKYNIPRSAWSYKRMDFGLSDSLNDGIREEILKNL